MSLCERSERDLSITRCNKEKIALHLTFFGRKCGAKWGRPEGPKMVRNGIFFSRRKIGEKVARINNMKIWLFNFFLLTDNLDINLTNSEEETAIKFWEFRGHL